MSNIFHRTASHILYKMQALLHENMFDTNLYEIVIAKCQPYFKTCFVKIPAIFYTKCEEI